MSGTNHGALTLGPPDFAGGAVYAAFLRTLDSGTSPSFSRYDLGGACHARRTERLA